MWWWSAGAQQREHPHGVGEHPTSSALDRIQMCVFVFGSHAVQRTDERENKVLNVDSSASNNGLVIK